MQQLQSHSSSHFYRARGAICEQYCEPGHGAAVGQYGLSQNVFRPPKSNLMSIDRIEVDDGPKIGFAERDISFRQALPDDVAERSDQHTPYRPPTPVVPPERVRDRLLPRASRSPSSTGSWRRTQSWARRSLIWQARNAAKFTCFQRLFGAASEVEQRLRSRFSREFRMLTDTPVSSTAPDNTLITRAERVPNRCRKGA